MTAIFLVRHPETTWNAASRYQGRLESPLSNRGRLQATSVSKYFASAAIASIYSSPLRRARELADAIQTQTQAFMRIDQRLSEIAQGPWEGLYVHQIEAAQADLYRQWYIAPDTVRFHPGEALADVQLRALSVVARATRENAGAEVILVTHSVVIQTLVCAALDIPLRALHSVRVSNGGITVLCGSHSPPSLLSLNALDALYGSTLIGAGHEQCVQWKQRRFVT